jgi:hypothetical protein
MTRLSFYLFSEKFTFSNKNSFLFGIVGCAAVRFFLGSYTSFQAFIYLSIIMGFFRAFVNVHYLLVVSEHCSNFLPQKLSSAVSLNMIICAVFVITFGQLFGWSRMGNDDYVQSFYLENYLVIAVLVTWLFTK